MSNEVTRWGHFREQMIRDVLKGTHDLREDTPLRVVTEHDGSRELVPLERRTPHLQALAAETASQKKQQQPSMFHRQVLILDNPVLGCAGAGLEVYGRTPTPRHEGSASGSRGRPCKLGQKVENSETGSRPGQ